MSFQSRLILFTWRQIITYIISRKNSWLRVGALCLDRLALHTPRYSNWASGEMEIGSHFGRRCRPHLGLMIVPRCVCLAEAALVRSGAHQKKKKV